jgi:hypothetical protein
MANDLVLASKVKGAFNLKDGKGSKIAFGLTPLVSAECRTNTENILSGKATVPTFHFAVKHPTKDVLIKDWERIEKLLANSDYDPQEEVDGKVVINTDALQMTCLVKDDGTYQYQWKALTAAPAETSAPARR